MSRITTRACTVAFCVFHMHSITTHSQYMAVLLSQTADLDAGSVVGLCYQGNISVVSRHPLWVVKRTTAGIQSGKPPEPHTHPCCSPKTNSSKTAFVFKLHTSIPQAVLWRLRNTTSYQ